MHVPTPPTDARDLQVAVVVSRYHEEITTALALGARAAFLAAGGARSDLREVVAPGAFELPVICAAVAEEGDVDAIVALGCIVTGETRHDEYLASAVAHALVQLSVTSGVPVTFGVLTVPDLDAARARAGGVGADGVAHGNKGAEALIAAIDAVRAIRGDRPAAEAEDGL